MKNLKTVTSDAVALLKTLIAIPSVSREEDARAAFLQTYIEKHGHTVHREGNNLWCVSPDFSADKETVMLNSHIDTVRPVAGWMRNPYLPIEEEGRIYGLGSNDAGASLVTLLHLFFELCRTPQPVNYIFVASCEEEISGAGGIERVLPLLPPVAFALVGEPTDMQPAIAEKGLMVLDCTVHGRAGHAARDEGDNAIYRALPIIEWFRTYRFERVSPLLGAVKATVTLIHAGTQHNVVPDECTFTVDVRSNECYSNEELYALITRQRPDCDIRARSFRLNSSHIADTHPFVHRCIALGREPFGSPTLSDQSLMPFPSLKMGVGQSSRSHTADEFVCVREIEEAVTLYASLFCCK
ncbi:MAG: M20 family metallo-hydrolase [Prevotellaceae bacterium]|jgi:acetylornithine deacetylase|nr:M20 family metallo-hydrolase [Prevotellaceae bacterium]